MLFYRTAVQLLFRYDFIRVKKIINIQVNNKVPSTNLKIIKVNRQLTNHYVSGYFK